MFRYVMTRAGINAACSAATGHRNPAIKKNGSAQTRYWRKKFGLKAKTVSQQQHGRVERCGPVAEREDDEREERDGDDGPAVTAQPVGHGIRMPRPVQAQVGPPRDGEAGIQDQAQTAAAARPL